MTLEEFLEQFREHCKTNRYYLVDTNRIRKETNCYCPICGLANAKFNPLIPFYNYEAVGAAITLGLDFKDALNIIRAADYNKGELRNQLLDCIKEYQEPIK